MISADPVMLRKVRCIVLALGRLGEDGRRAGRHPAAEPEVLIADETVAPSLVAE